MIMNDLVKGKMFKEMLAWDSFQAQIELEQTTYNSLLNQLLRLDLTNPNVQLEYAKLRGSLEVLQSLKATRERLAEDARSSK